MTFISKLSRRLLPLGLSIAVLAPAIGCTSIDKLKPWSAAFADKIVSQSAPVADQIRIARDTSSDRLQNVAPNKTARARSSSAGKVAQVAYDQPMLERHPAAAGQFDFPSVPRYSSESPGFRVAERSLNEIAPSHVAPEDYRDASRNVASNQYGFGGDNVAHSNAHMLESIENAAPIDLANALGIAGANNLDIQFARERVVEAHADFTKARFAWLPSLRLGLGYSKHDGQIQSTEGEVISTDRNSLFVGGGLGLDQTPLTGGAGGPARLFVNLSLADTMFNRRIADHQLSYSSENENVVTKQTLLDVSLGYFELVQAYGLLANAEVGLESSRKLLELTENFEEEGAGSKAEVDRARTQFLKMQQRRAESLRVANAKSERLKRLIRFGSEQPLAPADVVVLPLEIYPPAPDVARLVEEGLSIRNEIHQQQYAAAADYKTFQRECWRPLLPSVQLGVSGGMFGGGEANNLENVGGRNDLEVVAVWEAENMGLGNRAKRRATASRFRQSRNRVDRMRDQVREEVSVAVSNVESYRQQVAFAAEGMQAAQESYDRNAERIQEGEGLPIEMLQAIRAQIDSLDAYTNAVTKFNQAQFELIRAVGSVPYR